ncbi:MAG: hypothetical protein AMS26_02185 [Bacteroides sp. SM23_62]|nr:MAG: hypothetical protein AMS26_02185 [Bacteroides sp. SM23_62]
MTEKEQHIIKLIHNRILEKDPAAEVILYGSHARGTPHKESDWDILILLKNVTVDKRIEQSFRHHLFDLELEIGEPISVFVYSKKDWENKYYITPFYKSIKREGKKIHDGKPVGLSELPDSKII